MPGLVPGIHVFVAIQKARRGWPGHRCSGRAPFFERLCPTMTTIGSPQNECLAGLAAQYLRFGRAPVLRLFVAFGVAVEGALEIAERDDETRPTVDEAAFENIMFEKRP